jgi:predicted nuclease of restriction endonuclease-like (RecB) superfamily
MKDFKHLLLTIEQIHENLQANAVNAVNQLLTMRNWLIGYYIVEFEQHGEDRAQYGDKLIDTIAKKLKSVKGIDRRSLFKFKQLYQYYPQFEKTIRASMMGELKSILPIQELNPKVGALTTLLPQNPKVGLPTTLSKDEIQLPPEILIAKLSYTHFELLLGIGDHLKRTFYELECIKATWSVRQLKRQINSLYFERSGLSENPEKLSELVKQKTNPQLPSDIIKNIYAFEFLDIPTQTIVEESTLETALLDHLQSFIIELGNGFCFEARQKRILIGENYYFIDLVFYHRVLKCHVLIDLKIGAFEHGDIGQLNTYLNYYKIEISPKEDNPPVGILLVAEKDQALVKYATAGMDQNLFIQKYLIQLPGKTELEKYIETELKKLQ